MPVEFPPHCFVFGRSCAWITPRFFILVLFLRWSNLRSQRLMIPSTAGSVMTWLDWAGNFFFLLPRTSWEENWWWNCDWFAATAVHCGLTWPRRRKKKSKFSQKKKSCFFLVNLKDFLEFLSLKSRKCARKSSETFEFQKSEHFQLLSLRKSPRAENVRLLKLRRFRFLSPPAPSRKYQINVQMYFCWKESLSQFCVTSCF